MSWTSIKLWTLGGHLSSAYRLGARVASRFAIDHPDKVERLILLSATAYFLARPVQNDIKNTRAAAAANPTWDNIREIFKGLFHDERKVWDDLVATRLSLYSRPDMKRAMSHILALLDPEIYNRNRIPEEHWQTLRARTLVVAAVDHRDVFLDTAMAIAKLIPNASVFEMKNCSHWPQMEDPHVQQAQSLVSSRRLGRNARIRRAANHRSMSW